MPRSDPALRLGVPEGLHGPHGRGRVHAGSDDDAASRPELRLVVTRGRLGVELAAPFDLEPVQVLDLALSFPHLQFPVELSGGVPAFRHKRGRLDRLTLAVPSATLHSWGQRRLEGVLGEPLEHWIAAPIDDGWLVGLVAGSRSLAFEVVVAPLDGDIRLLPTAARGLGLGQPPHAAAVRVLLALTKPLGEQAGGAVILPRAGRAVARALLPLAGMRAPDALSLSWSNLERDLSRAVIEARADEGRQPATLRQTRALELALLVAPAEQALVAGRLDEARRGYLDALSRAPRHTELSRRLAELDMIVGGRAEAALSTLTEAMPAVEAGVLGAALLAHVGEIDAARVAWRRAAAEEPYGALAARAWLELAKLGEAAEQREALDEAVARAPADPVARWQRFLLALGRGALAGALADAEHLEAAGESAHARHDVARRVAAELEHVGWHDEATRWYERALRYLPASIEAVAGMGRTLFARGDRRRALDLAARAVALSQRDQRPAHRIVVELARLLAEVADDRPAAIARVRSVPPFAPECFEARLLEARWRTELGDTAGAAAALARMADAVENALGALVGEASEAATAVTALWAGGEAPYPSSSDARNAIAAWLLEGARIQEVDRGDLRGARRLLELALRLAPQRHAIQRAYRRVALALDKARKVREPEAATPAVLEAPTDAVVRDAADVEPVTPRRAAAPVTLDVQPEKVRRWPVIEDYRGSPLSETLSSLSSDAVPPLVIGGDPVEDELLADQLAERLRADPRDERVAVALADALARLGRDHELLALLSARIDDAPSGGPQRDELLARRRVVLERLRAGAAAAGREAEAQLFADMLRQVE
jgi:tetratricopeptide (TPR) repeat protein